jgi:thioredoxin reductase
VPRVKIDGAKELMSARDDASREMYDVVIVGGGAAGLSAAIALGRALRRVVVIDAAQPRNSPAEHMHGFLGHDGLPPVDLLEKGRAEAERYGVTMLQDGVVSLARHEDSDDLAFTSSLASGAQVQGRRVVIAMGGTDVLPDIPGLNEVWGKDVHVCPYCHGYEVRDAPLAVIATGDHSPMYALMIRNWSRDLIYFEHERPPLTSEEESQFEAMGIRRVHGTVSRMVVEGGRLTAIETENDDRFERSAVFIGTLLQANASILEPVGVTLRQTGQGTIVEAVAQGRTNVPGIWVVGNVTTPSLTVVGAAAAGAMTAGSVNMDLIMDDVATHVRGS